VLIYIYRERERKGGEREKKKRDLNIMGGHFSIVNIYVYLYYVIYYL